METNCETKGFPTWFSEHEITKKIISENKQKILERRKILFSQIADLKSQQTEKIKLADYKIAKTGKQLSDTKTAYERAQQDYSRAKQEKININLQDGGMVARLEGELIELAAPEIAECLKFLNDKLDMIRKEGVKTQDYPGKVDIITQKRQPYSYSNIQAVKECMSYLQNALREVETFKVSEIENLSERLERIKKNIPDISKTVLYEKEV